VFFFKPENLPNKKKRKMTPIIPCIHRKTCQLISQVRHTSVSFIYQSCVFECRIREKFVNVDNFLDAIWQISLHKFTICHFFNWFARCSRYR
jgi:hypothetical protein